jgi:response regulator RpfG family c-di-GMP phosphodiesterase
MAETTFTKTINEEDVELRAAQIAAEAVVNLMPNVSEAVKAQMRKQIRASKKVEDLRAMEKETLEAIRAAAKQVETNNDCSDGEHCQKIVSEENLNTLLAEGYKFVAPLPSGKCVVENA